MAQNLSNIGKYRVLSILGQGRFATVYQAEDPTMGRHVAIKVFDPQLLQDELWTHRLRSKIQSIARLQHPHIIPIFEIGEDENQFYVVMQLAHSGSLAQAISQHNTQRIPWEKALVFLKPICEALDHAHRQSVAHNDLKPANILIDPPGGAQLADFGLTRLMAENSVGFSRIEGGIVGSLAYIAPEVWETEPAEIPADIYALGCITYEMLTGQKLFNGSNVMQAMHSHAQGPQYPATWPSGIPNGIETILSKALSWDSSQRHPDAMSFWTSLKNIDSQLGSVSAVAGAKLTAIAKQFQQKTEAALNTGKLQVAKMAVNQWLTMEPDNPIALKARDAIDKQIVAAQAQAQAQKPAPAPTVPAIPAPVAQPTPPPPPPAQPIFVPAAAAPVAPPTPPAQPSFVPAAAPPQAPPAAMPPQTPPVIVAPTPSIFTYHTIPDGKTGTLSSQYTAADFLNTQGQLDFYPAELEGQAVTLRWFFEAQATTEKRAEIEALISKGTPQKNFLWPKQVVTSPEVPGFGYIMDAKDARYKNIEELVKRWVEPTFYTLTTTLLELVNSFMSLHMQGLCFSEIAAHNIHFDPLSGELLLTYSDNIVENGKPSTLPLSDPRFMAPEIVRGEAAPNVQSDLYSLASLLFYMLMVHHPLEGEKITTMPVLDAAAKQRLYGSAPTFIFDPVNNSNRPVPGYHVGVLSYWPLYPQFVRDMFVKAFTEGINDPYGGRIRESEWRKALVSLRDAIIYCPQCSAENFYDIAMLKAANGSPGICWSCNSDLLLPPRLKLGDDIVMLNYNTKLYPHHVDPDKLYDFSQVVATVAQHPQKPNIWGLRNLSQEKWVITTDDGSIKDVAPGRSATLAAGTKINFGKTEGEIRV